MGFGWGAVDFVGQENVGENRAALEVEAPSFKLKNLRPHNVTRHQVGGELDAAKFSVDEARQRLGKQRFGRARYAFEKDVSTRQKSDDDLGKDFFLTDNRFGCFGT